MNRRPAYPRRCAAVPQLGSFLFQVEQFVIEIDKLNAIITSIEKEMVGSSMG